MLILIVSAPAEAADISNQVQVVKVRYTSQQALQRAADQLDIWIVDQEQHTFTARVSPAEFQWLAELGYVIEIDPAHNDQQLSPNDQACYRTIDSLYAELQQYTSAFHDLTELIEIGRSYEGRPLYVLRLTSQAQTGEKPRLFVMANIHGREMITPEAAMQFIDRLLNGYGIDANITWLLDWHEIYIMPSANPDGHIRNELYPTYWRKNTQAYGRCSEFQIGVDLNRNHSHQWGTGGSSTDPCSDTYRGPSAASEPETQALQDFVRSLFPDQRGPEDTDPAPPDATGILISLHSYSNLVLWPWGWTYSAAPNSTALGVLGKKLAQFNGYTAIQANGLYVASGITDDWAYGELGIASYTFEIGSEADGFYPDCSQYAALIEPNLNALLYAARVARTPYLTAFGPDTVSVQITPAIVRAGETITLTARIDDRNNGNQPVTAAEAYLDLPPWAGGTPLPMQATDAVWDTPNENVSLSLDSDTTAYGRHIVYVRGQDAEGAWGPVTAVFLAAGSQQDVFLPLLAR